MENARQECHSHRSAPDPQKGPADEAAPITETRSVYRIVNMDCPMEEALIRKKLSSLSGIRNLEFNLMQRLLTVEHDAGMREEIETALNSIDMHPEAVNDNSAPPPAPARELPWKKLAWACVAAALSEICELLYEWRLPVAGLDLGAPGPAGFPLGQSLSFLLALIAICLSGISTFRKGWLALVNFNLNINALMAVAVTGAVLIGQFPEAAMVMALFNISEAIEARALDRARNAIRDLLALAPATVTVRQPDGSWIEIPLEQAVPGTLARARPGEKIALDGQVVTGQSLVNQAPITGESAPVPKKPGDMLFAGTINEDGALEYRITAGARDTTLARIIRAVEEAQASRAPVQRFVDVFAKYYTPCVFLLALIWAISQPLFFGAPWRQTIYSSLVILVIGCPCALVISTPITVVSALAAATRRGILAKGGLYLEQARRLKQLAFDKTGTLTHGQPKQTDFIPLAKYDSADMLAIAASLAARSDHPVSKAVHEAAGNTALMEVTDFRALPGMGVAGNIGGATWHLGNYRLMESLGHASPALAAKFANLESQGKTVIALAGTDGPVAIFAAADTARDSAIAAIRELAKLDVECVMLTGDNRHAAQAIANLAGIGKVHSDLLPEDKLKILEESKNSGQIVGMVGDGINDSPALAKADIGFAMAAGGTDTAIETADVALMDDDLRKIPAFIRLSRITHAILIENITIALGIKAFFFALTFAGHATMWMAVFADVGAALIVVANGLRILGKRF